MMCWPDSSEDFRLGRSAYEAAYNVEVKQLGIDVRIPCLSNTSLVDKLPSGGV